MALPDKRRFAKYTIWNFLGMAAPMVVAIFAFPILIHGLGKERFGALSLVWMLVGYFSIFDLGLGGALTKHLAEYLGQDRKKEIPSLYWTAILIMFGLGLLAAAIVAGLSGWLVEDALKIAPALQDETRKAFLLVAVGLPVVISTAGLVGALEALQAFGVINIVRLFTGTFTFIGPVAVLPFSNSLTAVVGVLVAGRIAEWLVYFTLNLKLVPGLRHNLVFSRSILKPLFSFGGWLTVSNIVVPLMNHIDRYVIGALISVGAVTYYVTSAEIVIKLLIFPRALVSVLFPSIAAHFYVQRSATTDLFQRSTRYLMLVMFPVTIVIIALAPEGLTLWLGQDIAEHSAPIMRWLVVGVYLLSMAYLPYTLLQGSGKPELPARRHLLELPLYLVLIWYMTKHFGIIGTAQAWVIRAAVDLILMYALALRLLPEGRNQILITLGVMTGSLLLFLPAAWPVGLLHRCLAGIGCAGVFYLVSWFYLLRRVSKS